MKRWGLQNKPMIIGLKESVFDIADTFRKAYPNARILYPGKNDFSKQNRQRIFNDIKNNDWDCIILTHEQFGMIPQADRKSTRLNSSHANISYAVFCLKKKKKNNNTVPT